MKKLLLFLLTLLCITAFAISCASAERDAVIILELREREIISESKLPESVEIIEDEAFEGTSLIKVELPGTVKSIGERAFANISTLRDVRIPVTTQYIASSAFDRSDRTTIIAPANSYARAYAKKRGLPFSPIVAFCATTYAPITISFTSDRSTDVVETDDRHNINPETQWRRIEELNVIRSEELIANHVQGRAPPMA